MELFIREEEFKNLLIEWLVYHNSSKRHHFSLNLKSPLQYILNNYKMANMCLTNTVAWQCKTLFILWTMDNFELLQKKIELLIKNYITIRDDVFKLKAENSFLKNEINKLRKTNYDLMSFKDKQSKIVDRMKKIIKKIDSLKGV